jgi:hypothetical protein
MIFSGINTQALALSVSAAALFVCFPGFYHLGVGSNAVRHTHYPQSNCVYNSPLTRSALTRKAVVVSIGVSPKEGVDGNSKKKYPAQH